MFSRSPRACCLAACLGFVLATVSCSKTPPVQLKTGRVLRVCSDPNNLPFSNERQSGFENRIAALVASEMGATVEYTWWAQRRGFIRNTLNASQCDVVVGLPSGSDMALTTRPYYRSTYVFVYPPHKGFTLRSFDDPVLRKLRIGVQMIGDDASNTPPAHALSRRNIVSNVTGYTVYGDYAQPNPTSRIMEAVASGAVDIAVVWGPVAGYFRKTHAVPLEMQAVTPEIELPYLPFVFDISMAVRRGDDALRDELDRIIERRSDSIRSILEEYGVPLVDSQPHLASSKGL